jgi:hypothetical protein
MSITIKEDLVSVSSILYETFQTLPFKRDYDASFGRIGNILRKYGIEEDPRNLRFRFILCMQEFFDSIPEDKWRLKDPDFLKRADDTGIIKFMEWIIEQIT